MGVISMGEEVDDMVGVSSEVDAGGEVGSEIDDDCVKCVFDNFFF